MGTEGVVNPTSTEEVELEEEVGGSSLEVVTGTLRWAWSGAQAISCTDTRELIRYRQCLRVTHRGQGHHRASKAHDHTEHSS